MPFVVSIVLLALAILSAAVAAPDAAALAGELPTGISLHRGRPYNYTIGKIRWKGIEEVGRDRELQGNVQEVIAQVQAIDPSFVMPSRTGTENHILEARNSYPSSDNLVNVCWHGARGPADTSDTYEGISYLQNLPDGYLCMNDAAAPDMWTCGRISCNNDSAIWWCNHKPHPVTFRCNIFAEYAMNIAAMCNLPGVTWGQRFDLDFDIAPSWQSLPRRIVAGMWRPSCQTCWFAG